MSTLLFLLLVVSEAVIAIPTQKSIGNQEPQFQNLQQNFVPQNDSLDYVANSNQNEDDYGVNEELPDGDLDLTEDLIDVFYPQPEQIEQNKPFWDIRWPNGIVHYVIDNGFRPDQQQAILEAFQAIEEISCIQFKPKKPKNRNYIHIIPSDHCSSKVGFTGGEQIVHLISSRPGTGCFKKFKIIHELFHALGFIHQQNLPNRDQYIKVLYENVREKNKRNFRVVARSITDFGLPYDYESIMHYGPKLFSKNGQNTIVPLDPNAKIGQRENFSALDIQKLNIFYECQSKNQLQFRAQSSQSLPRKNLATSYGYF